MNLMNEYEQAPLQGGLQRTYTLDGGILKALRELSAQYQRSEEAMVETLLRFAVAQTRVFMDYRQLWENLSRREKEVIALACLDHNNREIAARLGISPETVKTHLYHALGKLHIRGRKHLFRVFANWEFNDWNAR